MLAKELGFADANFVSSETIPWIAGFKFNR